MNFCWFCVSFFVLFSCSYLIFYLFISSTCFLFLHKAPTRQYGCRIKSRRLCFSCTGFRSGSVSISGSRSSFLWGSCRSLYSSGCSSVGASLDPVFITLTPAVAFVHPLVTVDFIPDTKTLMPPPPPPTAAAAVEFRRKKGVGGMENTCMPEASFAKKRDG